MRNDFVVKVLQRRYGSEGGLSLASLGEYAADVGNDRVEGAYGLRMVFRDRLVSDLPGGQRNFAKIRIDCDLGSFYCGRSREFFWRRSIRVSDQARLAAG